MKRNEYIDPNNLEFHYNRNERLESLDPALARKISKPGSAGKAGFFKRNKQMKFILLDIVLIVLVFLLLQPLLITQKTKKNVYGCNFRLESLVFEDKILLSLKIEQKSISEELPEKIIVNIYENNNSEASVTVKKEISFSEKKSIYIRSELEVSEDLKNIHAEIFFGDKKFRLHNSIKEL